MKLTKTTKHISLTLLAVFAMSFTSILTSCGQPQREATDQSLLATIHAQGTELAAVQGQQLTDEHENGANSATESEQSSEPVDTPLLTDTPSLPTETPSLPSETPYLPSETPFTRDRIIIYGMDARYTFGYSDAFFSQLVGHAFEMGLRVTEIPFDYNSDAFIEAIREPDIRAVIFAGSGVRVDELLEIQIFIERGGSVFLIYNEDWIEQNPLLQDIFGISINEEDVIESTDYLIMPNSMLPSWLSGLQIGIVSDGEKLEVEVFLSIPGNGGFRGYATSSETGQERLLFFTSEDGHLMLWPAVSYLYVSNPSWHFYHFMEDDFINQFDNEEASSRLIEQLLN